MHKLKKSLYAAVILLLLLSSFPLSAFAAEPIDPEREVSLSISYQYTDAGKTTPVPDARFSLYRVADTDEYVTLTATEAFGAFSDRLNNNTKDSWTALANELQDYVQSGKAESVEKLTDENGLLCFASLKPGLFLLLVETKVLPDNYTYSCAPFLIMLPSPDAGERWDYAPVVSPKIRVDAPVATIRVTKAWDDRGHESQRPSRVIVDLWRDGKPDRSVSLNKENNWAYEWDDLPAGHSWHLQERKVDNYSATITQKGVTYTITNKYNGSCVPDIPSGRKLPQTGMLWWPVPVLTLLGVISLAVGVSLRRSERG